MSIEILPPLTEADVRRADAYAEAKHQGQVRKIDGVTPFITHSRRVEVLVRTYSGLTGQALYLACIVALLHDVVEDTDATVEDIAREFGRFIAVCVSAMSNDESIECPGVSKMPRLKDRVCRVRALCSVVVQLVEIADRIANMEEIPDAWPKEKKQAYTQDEAGYILTELGIEGNALSTLLDTMIRKTRQVYGLVPPAP